MGKNNGGHQERSQKFMGEPHTAVPLNDDRAPIVAQGGQAGRSNFFKLSLQLKSQVVVLSFADWTHYPPPNCGLERTSCLAPTLAPTVKRSFSWSGKLRLAVFFFLLEQPSSRL